MSDLPDDDPRLELGRLAASLRAYLEVQRDSGATGVPRGERLARARPGAVDGGAQEARREEPARERPPAEPAPTPARPPEPAREGPPALAPSLAPAASSGAQPAAAPRSLAVLQAAVASCTRCGLASTRTNTVFSRGNPEASIVFLGEAPGADEDAQGLPFVGRAGQLLDKMIAAMGLDAERDVYICNIVKCRPPGNRRPEAEELEACSPYLDEQLANVSPKVLVAMGNTAVGALFHTKLGITRLRGEWKLYKGRVPTMPTYHPSYLLRASPQQAEAKRQVWEDLQAVMKKLGLKRG